MKADIELFNVDKARFLVRKEEVIENLNRYSNIEKNGRLIAANYNNWKGKICSIDTVFRLFGTWEKALKEAEVKGWYKRKKYSDEEVLEYFESLWRWRGQRPALGDFKKYNQETGKMLHCDVVRRRYGNYITFCKIFAQYIIGEVEISAILHLKEREKKRQNKRYISPRLRALVLKRDEKTCKDCGASPKQDKNIMLHIHHIVPHANGGETTLDNLVTNCSTCNLGKSNVVLDN